MIVKFPLGVLSYFGFVYNRIAYAPLIISAFIVCPMQFMALDRYKIT